MPLPQFFVLIVCLIFILAGFVAILLPIMPSIPLIWFGIFLYGLATNFKEIDQSLLILISILGLVVIMLDYVTLIWGGRNFRASLWGILGAVVGGLAGSFLGWLYGLVIGPLFGAILSQLIVGRDQVFALETKNFTVIGYVGGTIIKFTVGVAMVGLFLWKLVG